jgi:hypothetical protein
MDRNPASISIRGYTQPKFTGVFKLKASKNEVCKKNKIHIERGGVHPRSRLPKVSSSSAQ